MTKFMQKKKYQLFKINEGSFNINGYNIKGYMGFYHFNSLNYSKKFQIAQQV